MGSIFDSIQESDFHSNDPMLSRNATLSDYADDAPDIEFSVGISEEQITESPIDYEKAKDRTWGQAAIDVALGTAQGIIAVPEAFLGLADLVSNGVAGDWVEENVVDFSEVKDFYQGYKSDYQRAGEEEFQKAEGVWGSFKAAILNPTTVISDTLLQSLPSMVTGARFGKLITSFAKIPGAIAGTVGGAVGEGVISAGSSAEAIRRENGIEGITGKQALLAGGSGLLTGLFGGVSGKVASKFGIKVADIDTFAAGGNVVDATVKALKRKGITKAVVQGAFVEGILEEFPQSVQEQILQNIALDKDPMEGVDKAAVMGIISGAAMGGPMAGYGAAVDNGNMEINKRVAEKLKKQAEENKTPKETVIEAAQEAETEAATLATGDALTDATTKMNIESDKLSQTIPTGVEDPSLPPDPDIEIVDEIVVPEVAAVEKTVAPTVEPKATAPAVSDPNMILQKNNNPYKSIASANNALKLRKDVDIETHEVVSYKDGFAIAQKTTVQAPVKPVSEQQYADPIPTIPEESKPLKSDAANQPYIGGLNEEANNQATSPQGEQTRTTEQNRTESQTGNLQQGQEEVAKPVSKPDPNFIFQKNGQPYKSTASAFNALKMRKDLKTEEYGVYPYKDGFAIGKKAATRATEGMQNAQTPVTPIPTIPEKTESLKSDDIKTDLPPIDIQFQLGSKEREAANQQLDQRMVNLMGKYNVKIQEVDSIKKQYGIDAVGIADSLNKLITVNKDRDLTTIPEESVHIAVSLIGEAETNPSPIQKKLTALTNDIESWDGFAAVEAQYNETYKGDKTKIRREAVAKLITQSLVEKNASEQTLTGRAKAFIQDIINWVKTHFGNKNAIQIYQSKKVASHILKGKIDSKAKTTNKDVMLQKPAVDDDIEVAPLNEEEYDIVDQEQAPLPVEVDPVVEAKNREDRIFNAPDNIPFPEISGEILQEVEVITSMVKADGTSYEMETTAKFILDKYAEVQKKLEGVMKCIGG